MLFLIPYLTAGQPPLLCGLPQAPDTDNILQGNQDGVLAEERGNLHAANIQGFPS